MRAPTLFRRYPGAAHGIPWLPLGSFPTPVEPLPPLIGARSGADLWVKRDDLSAQPYGGNKVRKLEFLLADARGRERGRLLTAGAAGSHHGLATAIYGGLLGFRVTLLLFPQVVTEHVRRVLLLDYRYGAEVRYVPRMELVPALLWAERAAHFRERPYAIPPGGSNALGSLGYVSAALELADQIANGQAPRPAVIYVAAGTLGTAAGLAVGCALAGLETRVAAVRITSRLVTNETALARLVESTCRLLRRAGVPAPAPAEALRRVELIHGHVGRGYGRETEEGHGTAALFARAGLELDATYTAKAAAALLAAIAARPGAVHLFWHTLGGLPANAPGPSVEAAALPPAYGRLLAWRDPRAEPGAEPRRLDGEAAGL